MSDMYVNLHLHTYFSTLDGLIDPIELAQRCKEWGMPSCAITDHGNLSGIPDFYNAFKKQGVKPILGMEAYMVPNRLEKKTFKSASGKEVRTGYHLVLLAKNFKGYRNLIALNNEAHLSGFYYSPKIDWELLLKHKDGLIVSSACVAGEVGQACIGSQDPRPIISKFKDIWKDDYYIELMDNGMSDDAQRISNKILIPLAKSMGVKAIPTNDSHYLDATEQRMHDMAICMHTKKVLSDPERMKYDGLFHVKTVAEMAKIFGEYMPNTLEVSEKIEAFEIFDKEIKLPVIISEPDKMLRMMTFGGLKARGLDGQAYIDRLNFELGVIAKKGFASYMLTIKEVIDLIGAQGCPIGWGRGSAGGSLICYALGVTDVDPIKYGLLFERFISEHRPDWPDIDVDILRGRRDEIIGKIIEKYGNDKVAHISTFHYMKPKILIRDICRVAEKPNALAEALSKMVPADAETIKDLEEKTDMEAQLCKSPDGKAMWDALRGLLGIPRHVGMHASGVVISSVNIAKYLPVRRDSDRNVIQYSMEHMDKFGFLKFDLLGLEKLDLIFETAKEVGIDIKKIPLDDEKTYQMIGEGRVSGLFQLDRSKTCIDICKRMKPHNIQDLSDIIALNRPGVLDAGLLDVYLRRRDGLESAHYIHPDLKAILEPSFGVCIYQEDLMRMAAVYAGYTPLEVENLRKGIGKKDTSIIDAHIPIFREKALALGRNSEELETVLEQVRAAGRYSFNKSHSVAYAMVTYACGYLAANYPLQFFKNVINHSSEADRTDYLSEVLLRKFTILSPDINRSSREMTVEGDVIRMGIMFIKGIGEAGAKKIEQGRPYKSIKDVEAKLTKSVITLLHSCHALDEIPDVGTYQGIKGDEVALLGVPLHGLFNEFKDVVGFIQATPVADVPESGTCLIKISDIHKHKDKNKHTMAFCEGFDVHGPKVKPLIMFASIYDTYGADLKIGQTYGMVLSRLGNGGFSIRGLRNVSEIRQLAAIKGT